jgi:hypothetical protein
MGAAAGEGLPPDADTTAVVLYVLGKAGSGQAPDVLWRFDAGAHFCTWPGEDGFSSTTNAHVLESLASCPAPGAATGRIRMAVTRVCAFLRETQSADGSWRDRWHASPYYATTTCALALHRHGGTAAAWPVRRARDWVLSTQRPDGGWGRDETTPEETAYAIQFLAATSIPAATDHRVLARGLTHLTAPGDLSAHPSLWHDKDLYTPPAIIRSALLAARYAAHHTPA